MKLRTLPSIGHHVKRVAAGGALAAPVSQFRVASMPFGKEEAARWRQNGLWAGPCAGLAAVFAATIVDDKDARKVVQVYELRYASDVSARRVAALLGTSWKWNGHPFVAVARGANVVVAEGRYGAWTTLEAVATHFAGTIPAPGGAATLPLCAREANHRPIFQGEGLVVHLIGFAPSGALAWLEAAPADGAETVWTLHVTNLVNDRELAAQTYRTAGPGPDAFCAQHREAAGQLLADQGVIGAELKSFDGPPANREALRVVAQAVPSAGTDIVLQGPLGTKVLARFPASLTAIRPLGLIRSPFEERVAVLVLTKGAAPAGAAVRVLGGRLDKRWMPRPAQPELALTATPAAR